ncbi:MAG: 16S rRNA (cytidine(1402)-2'-O)-methyltransferase [Oscillospiraceae bacterium]|jgi:16S rRNA (cytidine1402-2'-O)-methyltransferase|nr:16S rRNA (cytidine(1402)-2'-O)-methyltransferase [Oscillospiraceae bacterium]
MPTLYVVATPIGNLGDMSPRAVQVLRDCGLIAAEDTRVTRKLLTRFGITTPTLSNHRHNEGDRAAQLVARMLQEDMDVALVTDAGTPCVSDPGYALVAQAAQAGIAVIAVPGPCAAAAALSISGIEARAFAFYGFLPRAAGDLRQSLLAMAQSGVPVAVVHESPHRVLDLMAQIAATLPGCRVSVSCDLTKLYELTLRGEADEVLAAMRANPNADKGEYCLVLDLRSAALPPAPPAPTASLEARLLERLMAGETLRAAGEALQAGGEKRNEVYRAATRVKAFLAQFSA